MTVRPTMPDASLRNRIPTTEIGDLFPGVADNLPLQASSHLFTYGRESMPLLLPHEMLVLAAIARVRNPKRIVEFGTAQGKSTYILAANSAPDTDVITVDLEPAYHEDYTAKCLRGDDTVGGCYKASPYADRVQQVFRRPGETMPKDLAEVAGAVDLVLIDGDHSYDGIRADTETALAIAAPSAVLLWHDFYLIPETLGRGPERQGVFQYLNDLAREGGIVLRHLVGTYLVAGCRTWTEDLPGEVLQPGALEPPFGGRIVRLGAAASAVGGS